LQDQPRPQNYSYLALLGKKMSQIQDDMNALDYALSTLIEAIPDIIFLKNSENRYVTVNEAARDFFEIQGIDWRGKSDTEISNEHPKIRATLEKCMWQDQDDASEMHVIEECNLNISGKLRTLEIRKVPIFGENGERKRLVVIAHDITEERATQRNLRIAEAAIELLDAVVITDANNRIVRVNHSFTTLTGYFPEEVIGKTSAILKSGRHDKAFYKTMWETLESKKKWSGEIWDRRKNGEIYPKWLSISAVAGPDGAIHNYVGAFTDLSEHKEAKEEIHRLAFYDPLTDLPNRRLFRDRLELSLTKSTRNLYYGAVLMVDLDNFKRINDTKGHATGDRLLIEVAQRLRTCVREGDTVARLGGDEFVIMLEFLSQDAKLAAIQAEVVGRKILNSIDQDFLISGQSIHTSLSVGISLFTMPTTSSEELLKRADAAMYQAKSAGRNTMCFFDPKLHASLEHRLAIESELRKALPENQFKLYFQAQVTHQDQVLSAEVLLRWEHPQRGFVSPEEFIPIAEETGLILPIGYWVLITACQQLKAWEANHLTNHLSLSINVSAREFGQPDFVEQVCKVLDETCAKASLLKIEITESLLIKDINDTIKKMESLKLLGIRFSVDDFGTGYSSLSYLKKLPISQLKIDRSFVQEIDTNESDAIIAQTIIGMANNLGISVIAEGVETEEQRSCLESYRCATYQGFLFSKPVPLEEFESLVSKTMKRKALF
jgi:diguanylate cyclase (GGDEF)-like protein/PAS domain S-box-containing protein